MYKEKAKLYERVTHQCFHNPEWKKFLDSLPTQHDKDIAGKQMAWIKKTYPQFADTLNGSLKWEHIEGKLKEKIE